MANPITPSGRPRRLRPEALYGYQAEQDIAEAARQQDIERRIREDNAHFERTGINRPPVPEYSPLVDDDRPDVANDGDSYDERPYNRHTVDGEYVEDSPTRIIDRIIEDSSRRRNTGRTRTLRNEQRAYIEREQVKEDKEFQEKVSKRRKKFRNAITGLGIDNE